MLRAAKRSTGRPECFDSRTGRLLYPDCQFVVTAPAGTTSLSIGGAVLRSGQPFDRALVSARRLRQMYDARLISVAPGSSLGPPGPAQAPAASQPPRGVPRRRSTRAE